jgi:integrase
MSAQDYSAMLAVAEAVDPRFKTALILAHETGHRIGAVRQLRWEDISAEQHAVRWRAEADKQGYEHTTPLTPEALGALREARRRPIVSPWVFPSPSNSAEPVSRHLLQNWWRRGERLAGLPAEERRGWHSLRRQFATELKGVPLVDLCRLGGWKSPEVILACYQQADAETMHRALASRRRVGSWTT